MSQEHSISRRQLFRQTACGFGTIGLSGLLAPVQAATNPLAPKQAPLPVRAKRVIFLFMNGGPSQIDTFDPKPELTKMDGKTASFIHTRNRERETRTLFGSPFKFQQHGQSAHWVSDLFPHTAKHADDLCLIKSAHTDPVAHGPATLFMHTGSSSLIRPSMGSWITYGLGSENSNLPGFITICPSAFIGGARNYGGAFLPGVHQGTALGRAERPATEAVFKNLNPADQISPRDRDRFDLLRKLNGSQRRGAVEADQLDTAINSFETAFRLQQAAPEITDLAKESEATQAAYGIGQKETDDFGRQCLLARRLSEAGVRFVQVNYTDNTTTPMWDQHRDLPKEHAMHARATDQPVAALLADLKQRGLLDDTLVWWSGEFGRTPYSENGVGRDHNQHAFTTWFAGAGVKPGHTHGVTDELGFKAVQERVHLHDLHATLLHLLGLDHEQLTHRHAGRDFRLTDVYGKVVREIIS
jgi:hypothetical protein